MPSKAPSATALATASGRWASSPRTVRMQNANGPDLAPARHQFSDADQRPGDVVDSYEATPRGRGRDNLGRLAVGEDRRAVPVQPNNPPSGQRRFGRAHPGPELPSSFHQLAPGHGVPKIEGADPTPDETLDRPAETQNSTDVAREPAIFSTRIERMITSRGARSTSRPARASS